MIRICTGLAFATTLGLSATAHAALQDRGNGLIYDDVLNVTWLADANLAKSLRTLSTIGPDGSMTRASADIWLEGVNHDGHLGFNDWRLPRASYYLDSNLGHFLTDTELGSLFSSLGGVPGTSLFAAHDADLDLFHNIQSGFYWTSWIPGTGSAWTFSFLSGQHNANYGGTGYVMLVRDGDVAAVPEPESLALMLAGVGMVSLAVRRCHKRPVKPQLRQRKEAGG